MAQAVRAILLASAIGATFVGRRAIRAASHGRGVLPTCFARLIVTTQVPRS